MNEFEQLGLLFQSAAAAIMERVHMEIMTLDFHELQELTNKSQELLMKSRQMFVAGVIDLGMQAEASIQQLSAAKDQINEAIKKVKKVQTTIDISAKLVSLAGKALSKDIGGVTAGVEDILKSI